MLALIYLSSAMEKIHKKVEKIERWVEGIADVQSGTSKTKIH
jgi:hypothetical protein